MIEHIVCIRTHLKVKGLDVKTSTNLRDLTLKTAIHWHYEGEKKNKKASNSVTGNAGQSQKTLHRKD